MGVGRNFFKIHCLISRRGKTLILDHLKNGQNENILKVLMGKTRTFRHPGGGSYPDLPPLPTPMLWTSNSCILMKPEYVSKIEDIILEIYIFKINAKLRCKIIFLLTGNNVFSDKEKISWWSSCAQQPSDKFCQCINSAIEIAQGGRISFRIWLNHRVTERSVKAADNTHQKSVYAVPEK